MTLAQYIKHRWYGVSFPRRVLIALVFLLSVVLVGWFALASGRDILSRWRFSRAETRLTQEAAEWRAKAEQAEARAAAREADVQRLAADLSAATIRAEAAEAALQRAQNITVRVRDDYDKVRNRDIGSLPAPDVRGLCARLQSLGIACRPVVP